MTFARVSNEISNIRLRKAFKFFDKDGSGFISSEEIKEALKIEDTDYGMRTWEELIKDCDNNQDGNIDLKEFTKMMVGISNRSKTSAGSTRKTTKKKL
jgi:calcium-dependent protein kinase